MKKSSLDPIVISLMEIEIGLSRNEETTATTYQAISQREECDPQFEVRNSLYSARCHLQLARSALRSARQELEAPEKPSV
jgi:hypothetical protein